MRQSNYFHITSGNYDWFLSNRDNGYTFSFDVSIRDRPEVQAFLQLNPNQEQAYFESLTLARQQAKEMLNTVDDEYAHSYNTMSNAQYANDYINNTTIDNKKLGNYLTRIQQYTMSTEEAFREELNEIFKSGHFTYDMRNTINRNLHRLEFLQYKSPYCYAYSYIVFTNLEVSRTGIKQRKDLDKLLRAYDIDPSLKFNIVKYMRLWKAIQINDPYYWCHIVKIPTDGELQLEAARPRVIRTEEKTYPHESTVRSVTPSSCLLEHVYATASECEANKQLIAFMSKRNFQSYYTAVMSYEELGALAMIYTPRVITDYGSPSYPFKQTQQAVFNTLYYMYYKYRNCFYCRIRNNTVDIFSYVYNETYVNPNHEFLPGLNKEFVDYGGVIVPEKKEYKDYGPDNYTFLIRYMLEHLVKNYPVNDCDFVINNKDRLTLKADGTEASEEVVGSTTYPLDKFNFPEMIPVISFSCNERYSDIPFPTPDDIQRVFGLYTPNQCSNPYINLESLDIPWEDRENKAVFRGSFTGSSALHNENPRLIACQLSLVNPDLLDVGITFFATKRPRKSMYRKKLDYPKRIPEYIKAPMSLAEQKRYKYILYIEGNVSAYRGASLFALGGVVVWVKSEKYHLWFEDRLADRFNVVFVKPDLSDLVQQIQWLNDNEREAMAIARNGKDLYKTYLTKDSMFKYMQNVLNSL